MSWFRPTQRPPLPHPLHQQRRPIIITINDDLQRPQKRSPPVLDRLPADFDLVPGAPAEEKSALGAPTPASVTDASSPSSRFSE